MEPQTQKDQIPAPWRPITVMPVGGLFQVGYATGTDLMLVLSAQGRGIVDCITGQKVARDDADAYDFFDRIKLMADGFGLLYGQLIRMAGLCGGGLTMLTTDGWFLEVQARHWPTHSVFLTSPASKRPLLIADDGVCEMRACGFSETGRSFVIATSCELMIYARKS